MLFNFVVMRSLHEIRNRVIQDEYMKLMLLTIYTG